MSTLPIKITVGYNASKAGGTPLHPVSAVDVADAIVNISEHNVDTPDIINACGPEKFTLSELLDLFKSLQKKKFLLEVKLPSDAVLPIASLLPKGSFEPDHILLINHYEQHLSHGTNDNDDFKRLVSLSRPDNNDSPLLTLSEIFRFTKRPVFGDAELIQYCGELAQSVTPKDAPALLKAITAGLLHSRINFNPNSKQKSPEDGVDSGDALFYMLGALAVISAARSFMEKDEKPNDVIGTHTARLADNDQIVAREKGRSHS